MYKIEDNLSFFEELEKEDINSSENICYISNLPLEENHITLKCGHKFNSYYIFNEFFNKRFERFMYIQPKLLTIKLKCPYCRNIQNEVIPYHETKGVSKIYGINDIDCENYKQLWRCKYIKRTKQCCESHCTMPFKETGIYYCENHYNSIQKKFIKENSKQKKIKVSVKKNKKVNTTEEIKSEEIKSEESKTEESKTENIILCEPVKCSFKDKRKCPNKLFKEELCKKHFHLKINTI
jgi:hypothetical protein